ncbi:hypothetical protein Rruber_04905 [Rhodococcus ruber]
MTVAPRPYADRDPYGILTLAADVLTNSIHPGSGVPAAQRPAPAPGTQRPGRGGEIREGQPAAVASSSSVTRVNASPSPGGTRGCARRGRVSPDHFPGSLEFSRARAVTCSWEVRFSRRFSDGGRQCGMASQFVEDVQSRGPNSPVISQKGFAPGVREGDLGSGLRVDSLENCCCEIHFVRTGGRRSAVSSSACGGTGWTRAPWLVFPRAAPSGRGRSVGTLDGGLGGHCQSFSNRQSQTGPDQYPTKK